MTVPTEVARQLGLQPDELLDIRIGGDAFVVCPQRATRPASLAAACSWPTTPS